MNVNYISKGLIVLAAYGVLLTLTKDLGLMPIEKKHQMLIRLVPVQILLLYATAYMITDDFVLALITILIYYLLNTLFKDREPFLVKN